RRGSYLELPVQEVTKAQLRPAGFRGDSADVLSDDDLGQHFPAKFEKHVDEQMPPVLVLEFTQRAERLTWRATQQHVAAALKELHDLANIPGVVEIPELEGHIRE